MNYPLTVEQYVQMPLEELRALKEKHDSLYYSGKNNYECIPDSEYDKIAKALAIKEAPFDADQRLSEKVSYDKSDGKRNTVVHSKPMLSIETATDYTENAFFAFDRRVRRQLELSDKEPIRYIAEPKYDGLGLAVRFENGVLTRMLLRGDGLAGEDVTRAIDRFDPNYFPQTLGVSRGFTGEIRGEAMMSHQAFTNLNSFLEAAGEKKRKNPRNAAAGVVRAHTSSVDLSSKLIFFPYSIPVSNIPFKNQEESLAWLKQSGYRFIEDLQPEVFVYPPNSPFEFHNKLNSMVFGIEMDGVVYKVDDFELQSKLGFRNREPRWAVAHKFKPKTVLTRLEAVDITVGRTGVLTPVARLQPAEVGGVTVSSCILENVFHIRRLGLRVGDVVELTRGGDVIPQITGVVKMPGDYRPNIRMPSSCPSCGGLIVRPWGKKDSYCINQHCSARQLETLKYFVSRGCMDIQGLGDVTITNLFNKRWIRYPVDIFGLDLMELVKEMGTTLANKVMVNIDQAMYAADWLVLTSVGIPEVGIVTAKKICHAVDLTTLKNKLFVSGVQPRISLEMIGQQIGEVSAMASFIRYLGDNHVHFFRLIDELRDTMKSTYQIDVPHNKGNVVMSGSFHLHRGKLMEILNLRGYTVKSGISNTTDFFLIGDKPSDQKVEKAKKLGVTILTWQEFKQQDPLFNSEI